MIVKQAFHKPASTPKRKEKISTEQHAAMETAVALATIGDHDTLLTQISTRKKLAAPLRKRILELLEEHFNHIDQVRMCLRTTKR